MGGSHHVVIDMLGDPRVCKIKIRFAGYIDSQSAQQAEVNGMTYWQFMRERIGAIREHPGKCQQIHFTYALKSCLVLCHRRPARLQLPANSRLHAVLGGSLGFVTLHSPLVVCARARSSAA